MLATGKPVYPVRVCCLGAKKRCHADKNTPNTPERDSPEHIEVLAEFPSGMQLLIVAGTVAARSPGFVIYGHEATLDIGDSGERIKLTPEKPFSEDIDLQTFDGLSPIEDIGAHEANWFSCIRTNSLPNANIELATKAQVVISLAEMSNRMNMMCMFDENTRKVTTMDGKEVRGDYLRDASLPS